MRESNKRYWWKSVSDEPQQPLSKKDKDCAVIEYYEFIVGSWTWKRLTEPERKRFKKLLIDLDCHGRIKGSYDSRWEQCHQLYEAFLTALDYNAIGWRESEV